MPIRHDHTSVLKCLRNTDYRLRLPFIKLWRRYVEHRGAISSASFYHGRHQLTLARRRRRLQRWPWHTFGQIFCWLAWYERFAWHGGVDKSWHIIALPTWLWQWLVRGMAIYETMILRQWWHRRMKASSSAWPSVLAIEAIGERPMMSSLSVADNPYHCRRRAVISNEACSYISWILFGRYFPRSRAAAYYRNRQQARFRLCGLLILGRHQMGVTA